MLQFIYELYDPRTSDIPGYLGITIDPNERYKQHLSMVDGNFEKNEWIGDMLSEGVQPGMRIREVIENDNERALQQERYWIRFYLDQGIDLTNIQCADKGVGIAEEILFVEDRIETPPLTDWQITVWGIGLGDAYSTGRKLQAAKATVGQLYNLFKINNVLDNIQGQSLQERLTFLRWMLLNTPNVQFIKQGQRFIYRPEKRYETRLLRDLQRVVFPPE
jgi:hypothetical protein